MSPALKDPLRHTHLLPSQFLCQNLTVRDRDQIVRGAVYHEDPLPAHLLRNLRQLLRTLLVPSCGQSLADEALARETFGVLALREFLSREPVAVGGEIAVLVRLRKP